MLCCVFHSLMHCLWVGVMKQAWASFDPVAEQRAHPALRCNNHEALSAMPIESFLNVTWRDNCPKPWLGEERRGNCTNLMACR